MLKYLIAFLIIFSFIFAQESNEPIYRGVINPVMLEQKVAQLNKPVLVFFWSSWCSPCFEMGNQLLKIKKELDFELIAICEPGFENRQAEHLQEFIVDKKWIVPSYIGTEAFMQETIFEEKIAGRNGIYFPTIVLFNKGKFKARRIGSMTLITMRNWIGEHAK